MLTIRKGKKNDLPYILSLIKDLAEYENCLHQVSITLRELEKDGFGTQPSYEFLVAEKHNQIIGMSFYWIRYSTWKGKILFLEDFRKIFYILYFLFYILYCHILYSLFFGNALYQEYRI